MADENGENESAAFSLEQLEKERVEKLVNARVHFCNQERGGREINLGEMDLKHIPDSVQKLTALRTLNLKRNKLSELSSSFWTNLPDLQILNVSYNKLAFVPISMFYLEKMTKLYLNDNKLSAIPDEIGNLVNLEELYLQQNKLTELPDSVGDCVKLQTLDLGNNKLHSLPSSMRNLTALQIVDLSGNKISYAPEEIKRLHDKHALLHSRARRRELIRRALKVRTNVSISCQRELQSLALAEEED